MTPSEVKKAVQQMKNNKSPGPDEIPAEVFKHLKDQGNLFLNVLFNKLIQGQPKPDSRRNSLIIPFYKGKGDVRECSHYRAIKLISHTRKIWERILNNRLSAKISLTPTQCDFVTEKVSLDSIL